MDIRLFENLKFFLVMILQSKHSIFTPEYLYIYIYIYMDHQYNKLRLEIRIVLGIGNMQIKF